MNDIDTNSVDTRPSQAYSISPEVLFQEVNGEIVLLSMETGKYYGLNEVASRMWHLIEQHGDLEEAAAVLLEEYDAPDAQLREDMSQFVEQLLSIGLIVKSDDGTD